MSQTNKIQLPPKTSGVRVTRATISTVPLSELWNAAAQRVFNSYYEYAITYGGSEESALSFALAKTCATWE